MVFGRGSSWARAAEVLFGLDEPNQNLFVKPEEALASCSLEFVASRIIEELGLQIALPVVETNDAVAQRELRKAQKEGLTFPTTARMAVVARELTHVDTADDDAMLLHWLESEERIFRAIERILVEAKLSSGFESVDDFIEYSLSTQNRRKSRMGIALQNHLTEIFRRRGLRFDTQIFTENRKRPDFVFPGRAEYLDEDFPQDKLVMLAAKSTCKERWPQILTEAARIPIKHLCTLDTAISEEQSAEMDRRGVCLVVPAGLQVTYSLTQRGALMSLAEFVSFVADRQQRPSLPTPCS
jgi:hypothetical protein